MFSSHRPAIAATVAIMIGLCTASAADAAVCARGVYRAGCVGPNGAVGVRRGYVAPAPVVVRRPVVVAPAPVVVVRRPVVVAPAPVVVRRPVVVAPVRCTWVNGRKVCR